MKMSPEVKAKWVAALRSGEYKQGQGSLRHLDENDEWCYCCLGVLSDLYVKEHPEVRWNDNVILGEETLPPSDVFYWAGMCHEVRDVPGCRNIRIYVDKDNAPYISRLNDECGWDFKRLAEIIEEQL